MISPDSLYQILSERIFRIISTETEKALDYHPTIWKEAETLINSVVAAYFDEENEEEQNLEELCSDMDQFSEE